jgi:hypothetical protein
VYESAQFEIWPLPATAGALKIGGVKALNALDNPSDRAELDDILIVLFAAAEWLAADPKTESLARTKTALGERRLRKLIGKSSSKKTFSWNGNQGSSGRKPVGEVRVSYVRGS